MLQKKVSDKQREDMELRAELQRAEAGAKHNNDM